MRRLEQICAYTALLVLPSLAVPAAAQDKDQTIYTYVAEWRIPRAKSAAFQAFFEKTDKPILDRLLADGSIKEWGRTTTLLHSTDGMTDGVWWCATSFAGIEKVLAEIGKIDSSALNDMVEKHQDHFLESLIFRTGNSKATSGFLDESAYYVKPGKAEDWLNLWKKWMQPVYEKMLADGTIMGYGIDHEAYHTMTPAYRGVWVVTDSPEAEDKVSAAFEAAMNARSKEERRTVGLQMQEVLEPGTHRDNLDRVLYYGHK